ncbi:DUF342 domain-containing protein [Roseburia sp. AM23-20]|uniref:DUF342 domain-containing protein n=1 Tax=Roseburia sp. AM23-20 TaxID=2292066 RepID=UPI000E532F31|nr:FapA family protein [Roseburia sp. AM23-20]RHF94727.1 DUF342 domain-containing protein [Roseburia sp. AM23-20]
MVTEEKPIVQITADGMEAYIMLVTPDDGGEYTVESLQKALDERGVKYGIDESALKKLADEKKYGLETLIARGTEAVDGKDGYYVYNFNCNFDKKPLIKPDGTVDYWSVKSIESVVQDQVIAEYHPCVEGTDGKTVTGKPIPAKRGREQLPLKGKGFERRDDNTYVALMSGKIETQNDRVVILPVHELSGNADLSSGNIDFHGDVVIHGSVESGVIVKASGTITVDGIVEACTLEAGKDIILRSGMLGGNKASVKTKGSITAKFFEFTRIECAGDIRADVLMDCQVQCFGKIIMNGKRGSIIGGLTHGVRGIEVTTLGNDAEKKTVIMTGASPEEYAKLKQLEKTIQELSQGLVQIDEGLRKFEELEKARGVSYKDDPRRVTLLRVKIRDTATLANSKEEAKRIRNLIESASGACVTVLRETYPGVVIQIEDTKLLVQNNVKSAEFYKLQDKIKTRECS